MYRLLLCVVVVTVVYGRQRLFKKMADNIPVTDHFEEYRCDLDSCPSVCVSRCLGTESCYSVGTDMASGLCRLYDHCLVSGVTNYSNWQYYTYCPDFNGYQHIFGEILAFRAVPRINVSLYDAFTEGVNAFDESVQDSCQGSPVSCNGHFRSNFLNYWNGYKILKVKVALHTNHDIVAYVLFDGVDANLTSWMRKSRIMSSSWSDLTSKNINYCAFEGHPRTTRRVYLNSNFIGCSAESGWLMVIDGLHPQPCNYDKTVTSYPVFYYGMNNKKTVWSNATTRGEADRLVLYVTVDM